MLSITLASHYSKMGVGTYIRKVELANAALPKKMKLEFVFSWHNHSGLIEAWAKRVTQAKENLPGDYSLLFSTHSLPERILAQEDVYLNQLLETSELIAAKVGKEGWSFSFQSARHMGEPWLRSNILEYLQGFVDKGQQDFLIAPIGFISDNLEILYDIDSACRKLAKEHGVRLVRCKSLNDSDELIVCLHSLILVKYFQ